MKSIYGFGAVTFVYGEMTVTLDLIISKGDVEFVPEWWRKQTLGGLVRKKLKGYWANVMIKLKNIAPNDYLVFGELIALLNQATDDDMPITIYPRADWNSMYNLGIDCFLNSKIKFDDKAIIEAGQGLELEFESERRLTNIPFLVHQPLNDFMLCESGDKLLTETNDRLIIER